MFYTQNPPPNGSTGAKGDFAAPPVRAIPVHALSGPEIASFGESISCTAAYTKSLGEAVVLCLEELDMQHRAGKVGLALILLNLLDDQAQILIDLGGKVETAGMADGRQPRELHVMRGVTEIAAQLDMPTRQTAHLLNQGLLPTFRVGGCPCATASALDDWRFLNDAGQIATA